MMHPATAPTLPCPARWPATPPTMAPLMHPFASAAAGANAMPRMAVQRISGFMAVLRKNPVVATIRVAMIGSGKKLRMKLAPARHRHAQQERDKQACERRFPGNGADGRERLSGLAGGREWR